MTLSRHPSGRWDLGRLVRRSAAGDASFRWHDVVWLGVLALLAVLLPAPASAQTFPAFSGLVVDAANVLPPAQEAALAGKLEALQKETGRQLAVATIPSLQGYPIEDYGYRLLRTWGVGLKSLNNGAILIVAPNERRVRVEVGYGLEPVLTDAFSSVVVNTRILPAFKAGDMPGGIAAGADSLIAQLRLPDQEAKAKLDAAVADYNRTHQRARGGSGGGAPLSLVFWGIVLLFILLSMARRRGGRGQIFRGSRRFGGVPPVILWGPGLGGGWGSASGGGGGFGGGGSFGGGGGDGGWMGGGFTGGGGGSAGGGGASGSW